MTDVHTPYTLSNWLNYLSHAEIDFLAKLARGLDDSPIVVNIGAGGGTSGLTFRSVRPDLFLVTCDVTQEANPLGSLESERAILEAAGLLDYGHYRPVHGDSKIIGQRWEEILPGQRPSMVFVDGDHSYDGCTGDIAVWWPLLKSGGVMAVHDYRKLENFKNHFPEMAISIDVVHKLVKPYPGVDTGVEDTLYTYSDAEILGVVDSLIAFKKK